METGDVNEHLPIKVQEKIIAMMPFPEMFKAMGLSRSWYARFRAISESRDKSKCLAARFQKRVLEWSSRAAILCPICITDLACPVAFNQTERKWQRLPSLYLPFKEREGNLRNMKDLLAIETFFLFEESNLKLAGPLLYGIRQTADYASRSEIWVRFDIWVRNVITGEFKQLPPIPQESATVVPLVELAFDSSAETYKMILVCRRMHHQGKHHEYVIPVYNSISRCWMNLEYVHLVCSEDTLSNFVYLNGFIYALSLFGGTSLLAFNVEDGTLKPVELKGTLEVLRADVLDGSPTHLREYKLVVLCSGTLMITVFRGERLQTLSILKIDLVSHMVSVVARCHGDATFDVINTREMINSIVCDDKIFRIVELRLLGKKCRMAVYSRSEDEWSFYDIDMEGYVWSESRFQPGLNPFMAV